MILNHFHSAYMQTKSEYFVQYTKCAMSNLQFIAQFCIFYIMVAICKKIQNCAIN